MSDNPNNFNLPNKSNFNTGHKKHNNSNQFNKKRKWNKWNRNRRSKNKNKNMNKPENSTQLVIYNDHTNDNGMNTNHKIENLDYRDYKDYWFYVNPNNLSQLYYYNLPKLSLEDSPNQNSNSNTSGTQTSNDIIYHSNPFSFSSEFETNILEGLKTINEENKKPKEFKWIKLPEINNLSDLIEIGKQWGTTWTDEYEYNVDIKLLNSIVPELEELNLMIGLNEVKTQIIDLIIYWALGLDNKNYDLLHTVIEGEPGTGKTELAEKLAKIYLKLGILKSNVFKKVKRADLVAGYLGQTAIKTSKVIEECKGGVLFIDEAYSLGNAEGKDGKDSFSKECIDTLNQALTESKSDFVCIIAGYADDLSKSFFSYNSGLERRFPIRFSIGTYTNEELGKIFIKKVREYEWNINLSPEELSQIIKSNRKYFKFNGGDMEILFAKCKISHSKNLLKIESKIKKLLDKKDILDGIQLYLLNPQIKSRGETDNIKKYIQNTMYI